MERDHQFSRNRDVINVRRSGFLPAGHCLLVVNRQLPGSVRFGDGYTEMLGSDRSTLEGLAQFGFSAGTVARKLLILNRRDVRVVEGARLESDSGAAYQLAPKRTNAFPVNAFRNNNVAPSALASHAVRPGFPTVCDTVLTQS